MNKKKVLTVNIKGFEWKIHALTNSTYVRNHGNDSNAITYYKDREIYFNLSSLAPEYVRHEILHAYIASSNVNSSGLTTDQMEELCCELYGEHGPEMDVLTDKILSFYLR